MAGLFDTWPNIFTLDAKRILMQLRAADEL